MKATVVKYREILLVGLVLTALGSVYALRVVPSFTFNLPHERDLSRAFLEHGWSRLLWGPEVESFQLFGGGYYALLSLGALFSRNALEGSALLAVFLHFSSLLLVFFYFGRSSAITSACLAALLFALSPSFDANLSMLWNPSYLPFFLLAAFLFTHQSVERRAWARSGFAAGAVFFWVMSVQIHGMALLNFFGVVVFLFYKKKGGRGAFGSLAVSFALVLAVYTYGKWRGGLPWLELLSFHAERFFSLPKAAASFSSFRQTLLTMKLFVDPAMILAAVLAGWGLVKGRLSDLGKMALFSAIAAVPALVYAIQRYVEQPAAFRHRYYIFFLVPIVLAAADSVRNEPSFKIVPKWACLGSLALLFFSFLLAGSLSAAWPWESALLLGGLFLLFGFRWKFFSSSFPLALLFGALFLWRCVFSSTHFVLPEGPFRENIRISQVREFSNWIEAEAPVSMRSLRDRLVLLGFGNLSALWLKNDTEHLSGGSEVYVFWNKKAEKMPAGMCDRFSDELRARHDLLGKLLREGRFSLRGCRESEGLLLAVLEPRRQRGWKVWFGNYGMNDVPPKLDFFSRNPPVNTQENFQVQLLDAGPALYEIVFSGKEISSRYFRGNGAVYLTDLRARLMCGGRVASEWLAFPAAKRMELDGKSIFPAGSSLTTDHMVLAPLHFQVSAKDCPAAEVWAEVSWSDALLVNAFHVSKVVPGQKRRSFLAPGRALPLPKKETIL